MTTVAFALVLVALWIAYTVGKRARSRQDVAAPANPPRPSWDSSMDSQGYRRRVEIAFPPMPTEDRSAPAVRTASADLDDAGYWVMSIAEVMAYWRDPIPPELLDFDVWIDKEAVEAHRRFAAETSPEILLTQNHHVAVLIITGALLQVISTRPLQDREEPGVITVATLKFETQPIPDKRIVAIRLTGARKAAALKALADEVGKLPDQNGRLTLTQTAQVEEIARRVGTGADANHVREAMKRIREGEALSATLAGGARSP